MSVPLSDDRLAQVRRWIGTGEGLTRQEARELLAELDRLRADNEALQDHLRYVVPAAAKYGSRVYQIGQYEWALPYLTAEDLELNGERPRQADARVAAERDALRAQVEAVRALADEADALIEERGLRRNGFIKSIRAALDKETDRD